MQYIPFIATAISLLGLLLTLLKILTEQTKANKLKFELDKRLEYKLRIHDILLNEILDYDAILSKFQSQTPMAIVDPIQIRKCIYEMLIDKTIVSFDTGLYTADTVEQDEDEQ